MYVCMSGVYRSHVGYGRAIRTTKSVHFMFSEHCEFQIPLESPVIALLNGAKIAERQQVPHVQIYFLQRFRIARNASAGICTAFLSVRPSVKFRCFVQTNEDTIMRFSLSGSKIILVSGEVKSGNSQGITPSEGVKVRSSTVASENLTNNEP